MALQNLIKMLPNYMQHVMDFNYKLLLMSSKLEELALIFEQLPPFTI